MMTGALIVLIAKLAPVTSVIAGSWAATELAVHRVKGGRRDAKDKNA